MEDIINLVEHVQFVVASLASDARKHIFMTLQFVNLLPLWLTVCGLWLGMHRSVAAMVLGNLVNLSPVWLCGGMLGSVAATI